LYASKKKLELHEMKIVRYLFLVLFICCAKVSKADDPGLPGGDPDVPLDGGILVLVAAGIYYGVKKIRNKNDNETDGI
jgi:hypothetical protein